MPPFIVFALPRSRTAWLSRFLTYGDWACGHDEMRHARSMADIRSWFAQPNTGTAETGAAPFWRTVQHLQPDIRVLVVRRPVPEVVDSLMRVGQFDRDKLVPLMHALDRKLDQIERRMANVLPISFADLAHEKTCAAAFTHCLPYAHDGAWWRHISPMNIQINMPALMRYFQAHRVQLDKLAAQVKCLTLAELTRRPARGLDDIVIREESFEDFYRDSQKLFAEHLTLVDQHPDAFRHKNLELFRVLDQIGAMQILVARSNGRVFGYLMTIISPSLENPEGKLAAHATFYASPEFPRLGRHLQLVARDRLRERGVHELVLRAGVHGDGPRMGTLYRRLGAEDDGHLFKLQLN